jgi:stage III sporulation protein AD
VQILQIVGLAVVASIALLLIRRERPELAFGLTLLTGTVIFLLLLPWLSSVIAVFREIASQSGVEPLYVGVVMKVLAISYMADFGAAICRDAGEELIASRVELAGRILILVCALPIIEGVMSLVQALLR